MSAAVEAFPPCYQLGFITRTMADMQRHLQQAMGVPEFFVFPDIKFEEVSYRGQPATCRVNVAIGYSGATQIEIVEPISGTGEYADFLARGQEGLHHIGLLTTDFDAEMARVERAALPVIQSGVIGAERAIRFAFLDTRATLGIVTEIVWLAPDMRRLYDRIRERGLRQAQARPQP